jgi:4-coumarate--CoA ligase
MPDKLAFADAANPEAYHITREEFRQWSLRFARGLTDSGLFKKGDRLLFFSSNNLFVPVALMGTLCAGGIFTGANPTFTPRELAHQLSDSGAAILLCTDANIDIAIEAAKQAGMDRSRVFVFNAVSKAVDTGAISCHPLLLRRHSNGTISTSLARNTPRLL